MVHVVGATTSVFVVCQDCGAIGSAYSVSVHRMVFTPATRWSRMAINALKVIKWVGYRMINIKPYIRKVNVMVQRSVVAVSVFVGVGWYVDGWMWNS